jgi:GH24 family phage-related lysozyme (muramidase)
MKASVMAAFKNFTAKFEGALNYMYTDVKGLVTTGIGNLIDPLPAALVLPWKRADGSAASQDEITAEWNTVKQAWPGVQSAATSSITTLHLTDADVSTMVASKAQENEVTLRRYFPQYDSFPADAQLGILSMSWALGAGFPATFKLFATAANAGDWRGAGAQSDYRDTDSGNMKRKAANHVLFENAAVVTEGGGDTEPLYWPSALPRGASVKKAGSGLIATIGVIGGVAAILGGAAYFIIRSRMS